MRTTNRARIVGYYGGDNVHAQAAWTSTGTELHERLDRVPMLLAMLAKGSDGHPHWTPFERSLLHFNVTVDTATHIHLLKHRTIAANGESARYKELKADRYHIPDDWPEADQQALEAHIIASYEKYHAMVAQLTPALGRARAKESARFFLPYGIQITLDISMSFRAFVAFIGLRNSPGAQREIRLLAQQMLELVIHETNGEFEHSMAAFRLSGSTLT